jgi:hypothetical protein
MERVVITLEDGTGEAEEVSFPLLAGRFVKTVTPGRPPTAS